MIQHETRLIVADNTGAKEILCIHVMGGFNARYGYVATSSWHVEEGHAQQSVKKAMW